MKTTLEQSYRQIIENADFVIVKTKGETKVIKDRYMLHEVEPNTQKPENDYNILASPDQ